MADLALTPEDEKQIRDILIAWRDEDGVTEPLLPMDVDGDGDGLVDSWGLGPNDSVVVVPARPLEETVFRSDGDGLVESGAAGEGD